MAVGEPFARGDAQHIGSTDRAPSSAPSWSTARSPRSTIPRVWRSPTTARQLSYDALVVAIGAGSEPAFSRALTWTPESDAEVFGGLLRDIEEGYTKQRGVRHPVGVAWPLPAYELALMTAWEADSMGQRDLRITIYTPESAPLDGVRAARRGRRPRGPGGGAHARRDERGRRAHRARLRRRARRPALPGRVVALPRAVGPALPGLANDVRGFIQVDAHGKVFGTANVWAAGDAIAFPVKQGGLAAQQARRGASRSPRAPAPTCTPSRSSPCCAACC